MEMHWVSGARGHPAKKSGAGVSGEERGTSLAVRMFVMIARGEVPVHKPDNSFRAEQMMAEERYCLDCCGVRWQDVIVGLVEGTRVKVTYCRTCGKVDVG